jgi:multiple sugar transport system ATP-binding protein
VRAIEALGPEQLVHVEIEAKPVLVEDVLEGLVDREEANDLVEIISEQDHALFVARLDPSERVREGDVIELAIDLRKLHFFDLDTGATI